MPVPPYRSCIESDDGVPVQELSHGGEPQRRGGNPRERSHFLIISSVRFFPFPGQKPGTERLFIIP